MNFSNLGKLSAIIGAFGLSAIALVASPESVKAESTCGPGTGWVSTCASGIDVFPKSWFIIDLDILNPDGTVNQQINDLMFSGPAKVFRGDPIQNPDGTWYIPTELSHLQKFSLDSIGEVTLRVGDGNANGVADNDLSSTGRITEQSPGSALAKSFFNIFAEIDIPSFGTVRNQDEITITGDRPLSGVSPDVIIPPPITNNPCQLDDPNAPDVGVAYCNLGVDHTFFGAGSDGIFGNDDDVPVVILRNEIHIVHPRTPEPSATVSIALIGLAAFWGLRKKQLVNKL